MSALSKKAIAVTLLFMVGLFVYWIKCQNRIDIFEGFMWERYLPLQSLQKQTPVIRSAHVPNLIQDDFNTGLTPTWSGLWSRAKAGRVETSLFGADGSKCLVISHQAASDWSFDYGSLFEVIEGQNFEYGLAIKTEGNMQARIGVILYDADRDVIDRYFGSAPGSQFLDWTELKQSFTIPKRARYMKFRVHGRGAGKTLVDDLWLHTING